MNVIILTPDRVGSTLLQRLLTIYMLRQGFDRPVINLHELTNGLEKYYNTTLNQEVLGKPRGTDWGYYQTLDQVVDLLKSVDHYVTSRTAYYHIKNRQDSMSSQLKFYEYINQNFYVISCRRENLFEQALSWCILAHSKQFNVYTAFQKYDWFRDIYANGITVAQESLQRNLDNYQDYLAWCDRHFEVQSYFYYEKNIGNMEDYILNLDFMSNQKQNTWTEMFGQDYNEYNTCHRLLPNLALQDESVKALPFNSANIANYPQGTVQVTSDQLSFLTASLPAYQSTTAQIQQLVDQGFLVTGVPIKLQSLQEKKSIVKNFQECVDWYNEWCQRTGAATPYTHSDLDQMAAAEESKLNATMLTMSTESTQQLSIGGSGGT